MKDPRTSTERTLDEIGLSTTTDFMRGLALLDWDIIVINTSGGKDSQAMMAWVVDRCFELGIEDRVYAVHADLGRMEWQGTKDLAERQCQLIGVEKDHFIVTSRMGGVAKKDSSVYKAGEVYGDLLDYVSRRGMWPDNSSRFCTSEFKRGPCRKIWTRLVKDWHARTGEKRPCRLLNCMGLRAQESPARAKKTETKLIESTTKRHVMDWLPILDWDEDRVWAYIKSTGIPSHPAYKLGMPRLSCVFCVFAPKSALMVAGEHNRELLDEYVKVEAEIGHTFRKGFSIAEVAEALDRGEVGCCSGDHGCWNM